MKQRPQDPVRESLVILLVVLFGEVNGREIDVPVPSSLNVGARALAHLAAPPEPEAMVALKSGEQRYL